MSNRGLAPTPYGEIFARHAKIVLAQLRHAAEELEDLRIGYSGKVTVGTLLAALNVAYRDVRYVVPFIVQLGIYLSPVGFSSTVIAERWRLVYSLNPVVGAIDGFRWAVLRGEPPRTLARLLAPGGRLLNHGIAKLKDFDTPDEGAFSERFVFPDGVPLPLSRVQGALERTGLVTTHVEGLQGDYARTLTHWIERFEGHWDDAVRLAGIERARIWRLYLRAARQGFDTGWASVYQVLAHKPA